MKALVIYESMFGNTQRIAAAIAEGLREYADTELVEVSEAPTAVPPYIDLLVLGGPTHTFTMSRPETRAQAAEMIEHELVSTGSGLREWIEGLEEVPPRVKVATFDTRLAHPRWFWGSAARAAERRLRKLGFTLADRAQSFYVHGPGGPPEDALADGEIARARHWGTILALRVPRNDLQPAVTLL